MRKKEKKTQVLGESFEILFLFSPDCIVLSLSQARKEGHGAFYRDGRVIINDRTTNWRHVAHVTENALGMTLWNCNGALWAHPGRLEEILKLSDILFLVETHQSPNRGLPRVERFRWESAFRQTSRWHTTRGSGGVAILFRRELHDRIEIMKIDPEARFMWVKVSTSKD